MESRDQSTSDVSLIKVSNAQTTPEKIERKIIRNAELWLESGAPEEAFRQVAALAEAKGGFVVSSEATQQEDSGQSSRVSVTVVVRVPAAQFDATVDAIRQLGNRVLQDKRTGQDVTEEYIDVEARLQAKRALEAQFLEIMKQAQRVADALEVQRQLAEVRSEIERIEGRKRFLENQASLSTIKVTLRPPATLVATSPSGFLSGLKEAVSDGVDAAADIILVMIKVVIALLPVFLLIILPIILLFRYLLRRLRRRRATLAERPTVADS